MPNAGPGPDLEGATLGKYQILKRLGGGTTASVYLAHDPFIDRPVAIKVAHASSAGHGAMHPQAFFNEAQTAGLLTHPHITAIHDAGVDGNIYYIVMEYVHGSGMLERHTTPEGLLPLRAATRLLQQCAFALAYAHERGVIHRDIKPRNILLTEGGAAKITDFGIALAPGTAPIVHAGSPLYMSPEQVRREPLTPQSDLFALGVVAFELLTGHHPFAGADLETITRRILHDAPPALAAWRADLPEIYQHIVDKCLARERDARYASGAEMARDLAVALEALATSMPARPWRERYRQAVTLRFFHDIGSDALRELIEAATWLKLAPGTTLACDGAADTTFYVLVEGVAVIRRRGAEIARLGAGDCCGAAVAAAREECPTSIQCSSECTVMELRDATLQRLAPETRQRFQHRFLLALLARLDRASASEHRARDAR